jgi:hypothetical protein
VSTDGRHPRPQGRRHRGGRVSQAHVSEQCRRGAAGYGELPCLETEMNGNCLDGAIPVGKVPFLARQDLFFCSGRNRVADWTARGYARGDYGRQGFSRPAGPQTEAAYLVDL